MKDYYLTLQFQEGTFLINQPSVRTFEHTVKVRADSILSAAKQAELIVCGYILACGLDAELTRVSERLRGGEALETRSDFVAAYNKRSL